MKKTFFPSCIWLFVLSFCLVIDVSAGHPNRDKKRKPRQELKQNKLQERETFTKDVYMFGVARNYMDSVTYLTNINCVRRVVFDKQTGFVDGLNLYTRQIENFLASQEHIGYLCTTFYANTRKKAEKMYVKIRKKCEKKNFTRIEPLGDFEFKFVSPENIYRNVLTPSEEE